MLIGFSVSNFRSFKDNQSISLKAGKVIRHNNHIIENNDNRFLKTSLIFGANAGGKSNLIKAVDFSKGIILKGLDQIVLRNNYFRLDKSMYKEPAIFQYELYIRETEYSYGIAISYETGIILSEWLVEIDKKGKETYIFNRYLDDNNESHTETDLFFDDDKNKLIYQFYLDGFGSEISDTYKHKTLLSDIGLRSNAKIGPLGQIKDVFEWFKNIIIIYPDSKFSSLFEIASNDKIRNFYTKTMSYFDTGIKSVEVENTEKDFEVLFNSMSDSVVDNIKNTLATMNTNSSRLLKVDNQVLEIYKDELGNLKYRKILLNHGVSSELFEYTDESDGTQRLFDLIPLFLLRENTSVIFIDEIDRSLHTNLIKEFFDLFYNLVGNNTQLVATTHDTNLLDLDLFRQDEIWFIDRRPDNSSKIYSLNKFKERFDKKVEKDYLLGRYGATPNFNNSISLKEELDKE